MRRVLLALIPVALLATASLALSGLNQQPFLTSSSTTSEDATQAAPSSPPPVVPHMTAETTTKIVVAQNPQTPLPVTDGQPVETTAQAEPEEPLPVLVVDRTPLTQAMTELGKAVEQAKLAVTALDGTAQRNYIQESINALAGYRDPFFQTTPQSSAAESYQGVSPLLIQARVVREAAEVQWIAAMQRQLEAHTKRLAELAQAGSNGSTVPQPSAPAVDLSASLGPTGVLGTRGVRPEEQANDLVLRAIKQAVEALRSVGTFQPGIQDGQPNMNHASDEAAQTMDAVVRMLDSVKKIIAIAADR